MQPALAEDSLEVREVGSFIVVDEDEVERSRGEAVFGPEPGDGLPAIAKCPHHYRYLVANPGVVPDAPGNGRVRRAELDRVQSTACGHDPRRAEGAVAAVRSALAAPPRGTPLYRPVQDLALLVSHVHHDALVGAEGVDRPDHVVEIPLTGVSSDVGRQGFFASVADLPIVEQVPRAVDHAQRRPPQKWKSPAADLQEVSHEPSFLQTIIR